jgi:hypothetical protein
MIVGARQVGEGKVERHKTVLRAQPAGIGPRQR